MQMRECYAELCMFNDWFQNDYYGGDHHSMTPMDFRVNLWKKVTEFLTLVRDACPEAPRPSVGITYGGDLRSSWRMELVWLVRNYAIYVIFNLGNDTMLYEKVNFAIRTMTEGTVFPRDHLPPDLLNSIGGGYA